MKSNRILRVASVFACILSFAHAQEPSTTLQSESRLVLVDAVVTDRKGNHVRDLTQKDFKVFEDNKEQTLTTFSLESETDRKHYLVLWFDDSTSGPLQSFARRAAAQFIDSTAGPNRLIAVAEYTNTLALTQNFTDDRDRLKQAVGAARSGTARNVQTTGAAAATLNNYAVRNDLSALRDMAKSLSALPGRKTLIFVSGGFPNTQETIDEVNSTIEACNRANVAIYPVAPSLGLLAADDSGGALDGAPATGNAGRRNALRNGLPQDNTPTGYQQTLYTLAGGTGGFVNSNTNDLLAGFENIGKEQDEYYILGYVPVKDPQPGACHTLKVKIDKSGDSVRARSGYCESKSLDVLAGTPAERDLETRMTANAAPTVSGASMQLPFFYTAANTARVHVALEIPPGTIQFVKDKGKFHSLVNIVGIAWLPDGSVRARFSDSLNIAFDDKKQAEAFAAKPFHYEKQFPIGPGKYSFKLVFSSAATQFGRLEMPLAIEPWDPGTFSLSGLALSTHVQPAKEAIPGIDSQLVDDRVPLVAGSVEIIPSGSDTVKKAEKNYLYVEIYEPALKAAPAVGIRMELLNPSTGEVKKDFGLMRLRLPPATDKPVLPIGLTLTAPELAPGPYKLRVTAMDSLGKQSIRTIDLHLEN